MNSTALKTFDLHANSLLATVFSHPSEVLADPLLSNDEKRCVLAAWASDAFAVEDRPWLRDVPGSSEPVPLLDILNTLRRLDDDDPPPRRGGQAIPAGFSDKAAIPGPPARRSHVRYCPERDVKRRDRFVSAAA